MMSMRAFARSAPRALGGLSSMAIRRSSPATVARSASILISSFASIKPQQTSAFSTSLFRRAPANSEVDEELSAKLDSEIQYETEVKENEPEPASVKDFLESGLFEVEDIAGKEEVTLRRTYGNEKITVTFSLADLANYDPEMYDEDAALADEDIDGSRAPASQEGRTAGDLADEVEDMVGGEAPVPCRLNIVIEKDGKGALNIEATAQDGGIMVDNMYYYADAAMAHSTTAEVSHKAQDVYPGPPFGSLDEDLQVLMERYLEERGITQALAVFVPDYMDMKEQKEYLAWLNNVKSFVDA